MRATIERHPGTAVGCYIVGGGYSGKTEELDSTVQQAAEMLAAEFNRPIEIRFNSDRRSGGGWLKNGLPGFSGNCQLGLCAGLYKVRPEGLTNEEWWAFPRADYSALPDEMKIDVVADDTCLRDQADANNDGGNGRRYACHYFDTPNEGMAWIRERVDYANLHA